MTPPKRSAPRTEIPNRDLFAIILVPLVALFILAAISAGALYGISWLLQPIDLAPQPSKLQVPYRPEREEKVVSPNVYARVLNGASSDESFYLDGSYTPRITVVDSEENCVLSLFAREAGDGYGTAIFNDLVIGNAGSFPGPYRQTFTWDSVSFSGETVRFYNDGGCDEVQLFMNRE